MTQVELGVRGTSFTWNGRKRVLHMATSFGWLGWIAEGQVDVAARWLDRVQEIGMDGVRVFGEYKGWQDNFFFKQVAPLWDVWDWNAKRGSAIVIRPKMNRILKRAIKLLQQRGMIMEYTVSATAKSLDLISGYQGHMCRAIAQWFDEYHAEFGAHNTLFEIANEYPTGRYRILTAAQINDIGRRWRVARPENTPPRPDHPDSLLSISEGGTETEWKIDYPTGMLSHVNIHSPRHREWERVGAQIDLMKVVYRKPIYMNENMHYMTKEQWDEWVPQIPKWAGISSTNAKRIIEQAAEAFDHGASYCLHYMTGMLTDPNLPMTRIEELWKEAFGPTPAPEPPPVIPPVPPAPPKQGFCKRLLAWIVGLFK